MRQSDGSITKGAATAGVVLGASAFGAPALLMGWHNVRPHYVLFLAMAWAPIFAWLPARSRSTILGVILRHLRALIVSTVLACVALGSLYTCGAFASTRFIE